MNAWLTSAKLVPTLGLIPLGAAVSASFMQRDPVLVRSRRIGEGLRDRRRARRHP